MNLLSYNFNLLTDARTIHYMFMQIILILFPLHTYGQYKLGKIKFYPCIISVIIFLTFNFLYLCSSYQWGKPHWYFYWLNIVNFFYNVKIKII